MDEIGLTQLAEIVGGRLRGADGAHGLVGHVSVHSDAVREGSAFFALRGAHTDGHRFVARAIADGARVAVVASHAVDTLPAQVGPLIVVDNPLTALRTLAVWWRARLRATFVAIAGDGGESLTKDALLHFLGSRFAAYGSPDGYDSGIGVSLSILGCPLEAGLAVIEAAAAEPGDMLHHISLIRPDHLILTNVGVRRPASFERAVEQGRELVKIADEVSPSGWLLTGNVDPMLERVTESLQSRRYSLGKTRALPVFSAADGDADMITKQVVFPDGEEGRLRVRASMAHLVGDVEVALVGAWLLGVPSAALVDALGEYSPSDMACHQ